MKTEKVPIRGNKAWAVIKDNQVFLWSIAGSRNQAIERFREGLSNKLTWKQRYRMGYRARRISIIIGGKK